MLIQAIINAVIQVLILTLIPFLYWLISASKEKKFAKWIGLKRVTFQDTKKATLFSILAYILLLLPGVMILYFVDGSITGANPQYESLTIENLSIILVYAFIQTGLSEELFFRGFLLKNSQSGGG